MVDSSCSNTTNSLLNLSIGIAEHAVGYSTPVFVESRSLSERSALSDHNQAITITSKVSHAYNIQVSSLISSLQVQFAVYLITVPALALIKLSFLSFCHRIFCVQKQDWASVLIYTMMCITVCWAIAILFAQLFACRTEIGALWGATNDLLAIALRRTTT